jgi:hypothetical protein
MLGLMTTCLFRYTPLKENWMALYTPITEAMKVDVRMNLKTRKVELKTTDATPDISALQKYERGNFHMSCHMASHFPYVFFYNKVEYSYKFYRVNFV